MTAAFSVRIPTDLLAESKAKAFEAGESFTAYVSEALRIRNGAPSLLDQPMNPVLAPRETRATQDLCAHPFRNEFDVCEVCGDQR